MLLNDKYMCQNIQLLYEGLQHQNMFQIKAIDIQDIYTVSHILYHKLVFIKFRSILKFMSSRGDPRH